MIEQLWYTSCRRGVEHTFGFGVRAASSGLRDLQGRRYRQIHCHLHYNLPMGANPNTTRPEQAPVSLSFIKTDTETLVTHKVYVGKDYSGRSGNYFTHALVGLPAEWTAREVIALWRSSFWQVSDTRLNETQTDLPLVEVNQISSGLLNRSSLLDSLIRKYLPITIRAFLSLESDQRLYIAAPPDTIAALIWGLVHSLPREILRNLTFTTYTHDVEKAETKIVGTCWWPCALDDHRANLPDLPEMCYTQKGLGINCYTGRHSVFKPVEHSAEFSEFATEQLLGNGEEFDKLLSIAEKKEVSSIGSFLVIYHLFVTSGHNISLSHSDLIQILNDPILATELLDRDAVFHAMTEMAITKSERWIAYGKPALQRLYERAVALEPDTELHRRLSNLSERAVEEAVSAIVADNLDAGFQIFTHIAAPASSDRPSSFLNLLRNLTERRGQLTDANRAKLRSWLFEKASAIYTKHNEAKYEIEIYLQPWLDMSWDDLGRVLELPLPPAWQEYAVMSSIEHQKALTIAGARLVDLHPSLFSKVIAQLLNRSESQSKAIRFLGDVAAHRCKQKYTLVSNALVATNDAHLQDKILRVAQLTLTEIKALIEQYFELIGSLQITHTIVELYLKSASNWDDWKHLLQYPMLAAVFVQITNPDVADAVIKLITTDVNWYKRNIKPILERFRFLAQDQRFGEFIKPALHHLEKRGLTAVKQGLISGNIRQADQILNEFVTVVSFGDPVVQLSDLASVIREVVMEHVRNDRWLAYTWLLEHAAKKWHQSDQVNRQRIIEIIQNWLDISWPQLSLLFALNIPDIWRELAIEKAIIREKPSLSNLTLIKHNNFCKLLASAFGRVISHNQYQEQAFVFLQFITENDSERCRLILLQEALKILPRSSPALQRTFEIVVPYLNQPERRQLIKEYSEYLVKDWLQFPIVQKLLKDYLEELTIEDCTSSYTISILTKITTNLEKSNNLKNIGDFWNGIVKILELPELRQEWLKWLADWLKWYYHLYYQENDKKWNHIENEIIKLLANKSFTWLDIRTVLEYTAISLNLSKSELFGRMLRNTTPKPDVIAQYVLFVFRRPEDLAITKEQQQECQKHLGSFLVNLSKRDLIAIDHKVHNLAKKTHVIYAYQDWNQFIQGLHSLSLSNWSTISPGHFVRKIEELLRHKLPTS